MTKSPKSTLEKGTNKKLMTVFHYLRVVLFGLFPTSVHNLCFSDSSRRDKWFIPKIKTKS